MARASSRPGRERGEASVDLDPAFKSNLPADGSFSGPGFRFNTGAVQMLNWSGWHRSRQWRRYGITAIKEDSEYAEN
jgi:hypothetical protein